MIENITEYNKKILMDYIKYTTKRNRMITFISVAIILICAIIEFIVGEFLMGGIFAVVGAFFFITNLYIVKLAVKKSTAMPKIKNKYEFLPESVNITTFSNNQEISKSSISLANIIKVIENENCLYLYLNKSQALLVDIASFKEVNDKEIVKKYIKDFNTKKAV